MWKQKLKDNHPTPSSPAPSKRKLVAQSPSKRVSKHHRAIEEESDFDFELDDEFIQLAKVSKGKGKSPVVNIPSEFGIEEPSVNVVVECYLLGGPLGKVVSIEELDIVDSDCYNEYGDDRGQSVSIVAIDGGAKPHKDVVDDLFSYNDDDLIDAGAFMACGVQAVEKMKTTNVYLKDKDEISPPFRFGVEEVDNKMWFHKLSYRDNFLTSSKESRGMIVGRAFPDNYHVHLNEVFRKASLPLEGCSGWLVVHPRRVFWIVDSNGSFPPRSPSAFALVCCQGSYVQSRSTLSCADVEILLQRVC
uniref:Uncharacterized protein n=1 Tax=Cannabis sativa TaxID=3483 RepID=A0A803PW44_CANSA